jgi:hypothetical protein
MFELLSARGALRESHHILKHKTNWILRRNQTSYQATWTSPTGHHYAVPRHDHRSTQARSGPDDPLAPSAFDHIEVRWTDWHHLFAAEDDGQSDWNSFIQDHTTPADPTEFSSGHYPTDYPHERFIDDPDAYKEDIRVPA